MGIQEEINNFEQFINKHINDMPKKCWTKQFSEYKEVDCESINHMVKYEMNYAKKFMKNNNYVALGYFSESRVNIGTDIRNNPYIVDEYQDNLIIDTENMIIEFEHYCSYTSTTSYKFQF